MLLLGYPSQKQNLFEMGSLGTFPRTIHLEINSSITLSILPSQRVPHAIKDQLKGKLDDMVKKGILSPVKKPTE